MKKFDDFIYKYAFHDTIINDIESIDGQIILYVKDGIYTLDEFGKETRKTSSCKIVLSIADFRISEPWSILIIYKIKSKKINEVKYEDFVKCVKKEKFTINNHYFSPFNNELMLVGYIGDYKIQIIISSIDKIVLCKN